MSFSFSVKVVVGTDEVGEVLRVAVATQIEQAKANNYEANVVNAVELGWLDQIDYYLSDLVGKVARPGDTVNISVSGHANPSIEPNSGWSSNSISVTINQDYKKDK